MITDSQTNFLYLADKLPKDYPAFYQRFEKVLTNSNTEFALLPQTKDVWAVDYMPIQTDLGKFTQYRYYPDYLRKTKSGLKTISNTDQICSSIKISPIKSEIILDGGNIIKSKHFVIMCDKVFQENPTVPEKKLISELEKLLEVDRIVFVPWDKTDFTGHADGMVRLIDEKTVFINDYSGEKKQEYPISLRMALHNAGFNWIEMPYNPYSNKTSHSAVGTYLNYLQMEGVLITPTFNQKEDEISLRIIEEIFQNTTIKTIDCTEIAEEGGILNCITWNIKK